VSKKIEKCPQKLVDYTHFYLLARDKVVSRARRQTTVIASKFLFWHVGLLALPSARVINLPLAKIKILKQLDTIVYPEKCFLDGALERTKHRHLCFISLSLFR